MIMNIITCVLFLILNVKKCGKSTINQNREVNTPDMKYPEGWVV
mgnify:CR=1 FL=1